MISGAVAIRGRRLRMDRAEAALQKDSRRPIVYLRSFAEEDYQELPYSRKNIGCLLVPLGPVFSVVRMMALGASKISFEEDLARLCARRCGPLVAIGRPGDRLAMLGAIRLYVRAEIWQATVTDLMNRAQAVIIAMGDTAGLTWEVRTALDRLSPSRLLFVFHDMGIGEKHKAAKYDQFRRIWEDSGRSPATLPPSLGDNTFLFFDEAWRPRLLAFEWRPWLFRSYFSSPADIDGTLGPFLDPLAGGAAGRAAVAAPVPIPVAPAEVTAPPPVAEPKVPAWRLHRVAAGVFAVFAAFVVLVRLPAEPPPALPPFGLNEATSFRPRRALPVGRRIATDTTERSIEAVGFQTAVAFTNRGARLVSWQLRDHKDARGRPQEMVPFAPAGPAALDIETGDADTDRRLRQGLYRASSESLRVEDGREGELMFRFSDGLVAAEKRFEFQMVTRVVRLTVSARRAGRELGKRILWGPGIGIPGRDEPARGAFGLARSECTPARLVASVEGRGMRLRVSELGEGAPPRALGKVRWVGVENDRFVALLVPPTALGDATVTVAPVPLPGSGDPCPEPVAWLDLGTSTGPVLLYIGERHTESRSWFW